MDVSELLHRLMRRWIAVLVIVVLAVAAAAVGWTRTGQSRQVIASVVIVPPKVGTDAAGQNPLLNLDNNLAQLATVLASAMQSPTVADALRRNGATGSFSVSTVTGTNPSFSQLSPQLEFTVTGATDSATLFAARSIVSQASVQLAALQDRAGVEASARATLVESAVPTTAEVVSGSRLRVAGSIGLGVLVLGLLALLAVDAVLGRRARRDEPDRAAAQDDTTGDDLTRDDSRDQDARDHDARDHDARDTRDNVTRDDVYDQTRDDVPAVTTVDELDAADATPPTKAPARTATKKTAARTVETADKPPATRAPAKKVAAKRVGPAAKRVGQNGRGTSDTSSVRAGR